MLGHRGRITLLISGLGSISAERPQYRAQVNRALEHGSPTELLSTVFQNPITRAIMSCMRPVPVAKKFNPKDYYLNSEVRQCRPQCTRLIATCPAGPRAARVTFVRLRGRSAGHTACMGFVALFRRGPVVLAQSYGSHRLPAAHKRLLGAGKSRAEQNIKTMCAAHTGQHTRRGMRRFTMWRNFGACLEGLHGTTPRASWPCACGVQAF